jgi:hypothetical protein
VVLSIYLILLLDYPVHEEADGWRVRIRRDHEVHRHEDVEDLGKGWPLVQFSCPAFGDEVLDGRPDISFLLDHKLS